MVFKDEFGVLTFLHAFNRSGSVKMYIEAHNRGRIRRNEYHWYTVYVQMPIDVAEDRFKHQTLKDMFKSDPMNRLYVWDHTYDDFVQSFMPQRVKRWIVSKYAIKFKFCPFMFTPTL